jgi:hypothetical protein
MDPINLIVLLLIFILISIVTIGLILMATFQDLAASQAATAAAIQDLAGRVAAITTTVSANLDTAVAAENANAAAVAAIQTP